MIVTKHTLTRDIVPILNSERLELLLAHIPPYPLKKRVVDMTIGEYVEALDETYAMRFLKHRKAFKAFGRMRQFRTEMEGVARFMEANSIPPSSDDKAAMSGITFPTAQESILLDARSTFSLPRVDGMGWLAKVVGHYGAADIPLAEYLLTLKGKVSAAKYEIARSKIGEAKIKSQTRKKI